MSQKIVQNEPIKAYKAFDKNFKCRGFQYEVGETYHIDEEVEICRKGFHACQNCMDVLRFYPLNDSRFAEVEVWGDVVFSENDGKLCASDIKIIRELTFHELFAESYKYFSENYKVNDNKMRLLSNGCLSKIACDENDCEFLLCDYTANRLSTNGTNVKVISDEREDIVSTSGFKSTIFSKGAETKVATLGVLGKVGSFGRYSRIISSSFCGEIKSFGENSIIASVGNDSSVSSNGKKSIVLSVGKNSIAKAKKGNWITLAEYGKTGPICVKTEYVDGKRIKEDTWYKLKNGEFIEVDM